MIDVDELLKVLDGLIVSITSGNRDRSKGFGIVYSLKVNTLDSLADSQPAGKIRVGQEKEPLVDVIETEDTIRIIVELPGIRKEDVRYSVNNEFLDIEIFKDCTYRKQIPCSVEPERISVKSNTVNNSVLEIVFAKNTKGPHV